MKEMDSLAAISEVPDEKIMQLAAKNWDRLRN